MFLKPRKKRAPNSFFGHRQAQCKHCGKEFEFAATRLRQGGGKYCSLRCWYDYRLAQTALKKANRPPRNHKQLVKICAQCLKEFRIPKSRGSTMSGGKTISRRFCGYSCWQRYKQEHLPWHSCTGCGKQVQRGPVARNRNKRIYCSKECYTEHSKGENNPLWRGERRAERGVTWAERRKAARERDKTCQCLQHDGNWPVARKERLSVDHIVPYRMILPWIDDGPLFSDPNHLDNLISLCRRCHCRKTTGAEGRLLKGDVIGFRQAMATIIPPERVDAALRLYGLSR